MGQDLSIFHHKNHTPKFNQPQKHIQPSFVQHESILKLRSVPFKNSIQISNSPLLFLQNSQITLTSLLQNRYNTTKLFTQQDILKLLESILYALAYLQSKNSPYIDLSTDNIYYDTESLSFKLFPIQLLENSCYIRMLEEQKLFPISPELIIAMRCNHNQIQSEIYHKSNVFILGMIILEVSTLKSFQECYDKETYDILDRVITERLKHVRSHYSDRLYKFLSLMLNYDYIQRMDLTQLSIHVNKQLNQRNKIFKRNLQPRNIQKSPIRYDAPIQNKPQTPLSNSGVSQQKITKRNYSPIVSNTSNTANSISSKNRMHKQSISSSFQESNICYQQSQNMKNSKHFTQNQSINSTNKSNHQYYQSPIYQNNNQPVQLSNPYIASRQNRQNLLPNAQRQTISPRYYQMQANKNPYTNDVYQNRSKVSKPIFKHEQNRKQSKIYEANLSWEQEQNFEKGSEFQRHMHGLKTGRTEQTEEKNLRGSLITGKEKSIEFSGNKNGSKYNYTNEYNDLKENVSRSKTHYECDQIQNSEEQSLSRIKQEIQKSRNLIMQFNKNSSAL